MDIFAHFKEIANSVKKFPIMLYNVPGRTASNIDATTQVRIAEECPNIVATKEASGDLSQIMQIVQNRPKNFRVFSGDDAITVPMLAIGADGLVSVCSNEIPKENFPNGRSWLKKETFQSHAEFITKFLI